MQIHTTLKFGIGICIFETVLSRILIPNIEDKTCGANRTMNKEYVEKYSQANLE